MTTRYVFPGTVPALGQPGAPPSGAPAYTSIATAVLVAANGDTIQIAAGTFNEEVRLTAGKGVTLVGAGVDQTFINAPSSGKNGVVISGPGSAANVTIRNLTITGNDASPGIESAALYVMGAMGAVDIDGCKITAAGEAAILTSGVVATSFKIRGCVINGQTFTGSAPAAQTWTGSYFSQQFTTANIPRQLVTINAGTFGAAEFTNNILNGITGGAVTEVENTVVFTRATHRANTVMTCDAPDFTISGNTFDTACYPMITNAPALRVRGNNCVVQNNIFKNPLINGYILDNKTLSNTAQNQATITFLNNTIDVTSAAATSGHTIVHSSYNSHASVSPVVSRLCWNVSGAGFPVPISCVGLSKVIESDKVTHLVYSAAGSLSTFASAVAAASSGDVIKAGPVDLTEALRISKDGLTIVGAVDGNGAPATIVGGASGSNAFSLFIDNRSNISVSNLKLKSPASSATHFIMHITGTASGATGIQMTNVVCDDSVALVRGVSINHAAVTFTNCKFPKTANYSLGIASSQGITCSGCIFKQSNWGTIGIFPSNQTKAATGSIDLRTGNVFENTLVNATAGGVIGASDMGLINIQSNSAPSVTNGTAITYSPTANDVNVKLPSSFIYAYFETAAHTGVGSLTVSNTTDFYSNAAVQAAYGPALANLYARNLSTGLVFAVPGFSAVTSGAAAGASISADLAAALAAPAADPAAALAAAASATLAVAGGQVAIAAAASAVLAANPSMALDLIIALTIAANANAKANPSAIDQKNAVAQASENRPPVTLSSSTVNTLAATLVAFDPIAFANGVTFSPAKSVVVGGEAKRYIMRSADSTVVEYTPMISGEWYNLLQSSEVDTAGAPSEPAGAGVIISQLKYEDSKLYFRPNRSNLTVFSELSVGSKYTIVRGSNNIIEYKVFSVGNLGSGPSDIQCIPAGQRILTAAGWRAVEELRNGDMVVTDTGAAVPAKIYSTTVITTSKTAPINIPASMFGKTGAPVRLSPLHAVRLSKGIWEFPYNLLRSRADVTQDAPGASVTYYHIALPNFLRDNMVLEGGVVTESYGAPFVKANDLKDVKIYTYNKRLGGYTRMAPGAVASKSKSA
jgi:hypothetical protein